MSYGVSGFKTKKSLKDAIAQKGADQVEVFGTSMFGNEMATTVAELRDSDVIVGPDVYSKRSWYANGGELKRVKRTS
jgi:hypothetical protein